LTFSDFSFSQIFPSYYTSSQRPASTDSVIAKIRAKRAAIKASNGN
jgi:hypothetical protein